MKGFTLGKDTLKWMMLAIVLYVNFFNLFGIIINAIQIGVVLTKLSSKWLIIVQVLLELLKIGVFIGLLAWISQRFNRIENVVFPKRLAITSYVLAPFLFIIYRGVGFFPTVLISRFYSIEQFGRYSQVGSIIASVDILVTIVILMIVGLVSINRE